MATTTELDGLWYRRYGDKLEKAIPEAEVLANLIKFSGQDELGDTFNFPVLLTSEAGITYAGPDAGTPTLASAISLQTKNAQVNGYQIIGRSTLSYEAAAKASKSVKAFGKSVDVVVENLLESATKRRDLSFLYGQSGLGRVAVGASVAVSATQRDLVFAVGEWAPGIWCGLENTQLNLFDSAAALVSTGADAVFTVVSVDNDNRTVRISGTSTGISNLATSNTTLAVDAFFNSSNGNSVTAPTAASTNECAGMYKIATNTGSLFGISAATYNLWKGTQMNTSGALTRGKLLTLASRMVARGANGDLVALVNPDTWQNLANSEASLRDYDGSYKGAQAENGFESLRFRGQNGKIDVIAYNCVKGGHCFLFQPKRFKRIGAQELSFKRPGNVEGQPANIFRELTDTAGFEFRIYGNEALICTAPAKGVGIMTGIVNEAA